MQVEFVERICRSDQRAVAVYAAKTTESVSYMTRLYSTRIENGCVVLVGRLGVDHGGYGGRTCFQPFARIAIEITLDVD